MSKAMRALWRGLGEATELLDYTDILHEALPEKYQSHDWRPQYKAAAVWKHFDKLDWMKVAQGLIENEIEDRFYGAIGKVNAASSRRAGNRFGWQTMHPDFAI